MATISYRTRELTQRALAGGDAIAPLADGGLAYASTRSVDGATRLVVEAEDASGVARFAPVVLPAGSGSGFITQLADGNLAVTYRQGFNVVAAIIDDGTGSLVSASVLAEYPGTSRQSAFYVGRDIAGAGEGAAILYGVFSPIFQSGSANLFLVDRNGNLTQNIALSGFSGYSPANLVTLESGALVTTYSQFVHQPGFVVGPSAFFQILGPTGAVLRGQTDLSTADLTETPFAVGLAGGGFAVAYRNVSADALELKFFDDAGNARPGAAIPIDDGGAVDGVDRGPVAVLLPNGLLAVTYTEGGTGSARLSLFDPVTGVALLRSAAVDGPGSPVDLIARDGDLLVATASGSDLAIATQRLVRTTLGDGSPELLLGDVLSDEIVGFGGNDEIGGGAGNDALLGGSGHDLLAGGIGSDVLNGGDGNDVAYYGRSLAGVTVDLSTGFGSGGEASGDLLVEVESLIGSALADQLTGDALANALLGGQGDDTLEGLAGGDAIVGGGGTDAARYGRSSDTVSVNLTNGSGEGGDAAGDVLVEIENVVGSRFGDLIRGNDIGNILAGFGGGDVLIAEGGDDLLDGGDGGDILTGGAGNDVFRFAVGDSTDTDIVTDFDLLGDDAIVLVGLHPADVQMSVVNDTDVLLSFSSLSGGIILQGASSRFDASDVVFV